VARPRKQVPVHTNDQFDPKFFETAQKLLHGRVHRDFAAKFLGAAIVTLKTRVVVQLFVKMNFLYMKYDDAIILCAH
jgi:hypothetical protein